ncbi:oxysterol-binding protein 1-like isoform X2 [Xenia sp. Carnegie-2017]|uniref:oxysterol-binding protein 1-like isoform X2 n=1 Tax=Xenia sp. Carnegie-2017 TaxID=2897299 RepID=UPI001F04DD26|nr:oxysterol-binding protein 1-like isoform X2 [Xenia sp. Carnegie-2017]
MTHVAEEDEQFLTNGELHVIDPNETEYELLKENGVFERNRQPRDVLPMTREKSSLRNWFSFLKTVIGKDLTKVTFPVCFNEPISFLQRLCEDLQYAYLLEKAAKCESSVESLVYIAAFMVSSFSTVPGRFMKPFNPLLGETYEYINKEYGYAVLVEQVSHHPPMSALHAESEDWIFWEEYKLDTKFRGQYVRVCPTGIVHLKFKKSGDHYSWKKPETIVHNIIFGTLWDGDVVIKNHRTKEVCTVHFQPYNRVKEHYKMITGEVRDLNGHVCLLLDGNYEDYVEYTSVEKGLTADPIQVWKAVPKPEISPRMYGLTTFAMQLNEPDAEVQCTTDCRKRPDLRNLEDGNMDEASREKCRLENKQRQARKHRENEKKIWSPRWFKVEEDPTWEFHHMSIKEATGIEM